MYELGKTVQLLREINCKINIFGLCETEGMEQTKVRNTGERNSPVLEAYRERCPLQERVTLMLSREAEKEIIKWEVFDF